MSSDDDFGDFGGAEDSAGVKSLRAALKKAKEERDQLAESVNGYTKKERTRTIGEKFAEYQIKMPPTFVPDDLKLEDVDGWISENATWLNPVAPDSSKGPDPHADAAAAQNRMAGFNTSIAPDPEQQIIDQIRQTKTREELIALVTPNG